MFDLNDGPTILIENYVLVSRKGLQDGTTTDQVYVSMISIENQYKLDINNWLLFYQ